jgi:hypothetical protein
LGFERQHYFSRQHVEDGTETGVPIFNEVWSIVAQPQTDASTPANAVQGFRKSLASDLRKVSYGFYKSNAVTMVLGLLITPVASVGPGIVVSFRVEGK